MGSAGLAASRSDDAFPAVPRAISRFCREGRLLAAVSHPNIATIFGTFEDGGVRFLVMELVDGKTLAQPQGIIHRDLEPANVMVSPRAG